MGVLGPVVEALVPPVLDRGHHLILCGAVAGQLVRDHDTRGPHLPLQQLAKQTLGGLFVPPVSRHTSSRCHLSPAQGSRRRIWLANAWPNLRAHCRTVSWLTTIPRAASISSTMRRLSGNRKYSQTTWLMTSAGKR